MADHVDHDGKRTEIFTTPGTYSWTCPAGVTSVVVECYGGGGGGGGGGAGYTSSSGYSWSGGAGASGAVYITYTIPVLSNFLLFFN